VPADTATPSRTPFAEASPEVQPTPTPVTVLPPTGIGGGGELFIVLLTLAAIPAAALIVGTKARRRRGRDVFRL
jgi:hypothetical protein